MTLPLVPSASDAIQRLGLPDLTDSIALDRSTFDPIGRGACVPLATLSALSASGVTKKVAVKVTRAHVYREENKWKIEKNFGSYTAMVCPWMSGADLYRYLNTRGSGLNFGRRLLILSDVAEGLAYLHSRQIIHGDLPTANILMHEGRAHLHDFGLSNIKAEIRSESFMTSKVGDAARRTAP
ncbi:kinase-like domain-containing protein [Flammula alnicola]|nr:kinase-like domain-containing protein [Flammula alnicola]